MSPEKRQSRGKCLEVWSVRAFCFGRRHLFSAAWVPAVGQSYDRHHRLTSRSAPTSRAVTGDVEGCRRGHVMTFAVVPGLWAAAPVHRCRLSGLRAVHLSALGAVLLHHCRAVWQRPQRAAARLGPTPGRAVWLRTPTASTPTRARCLRPDCDPTPAASSAFASRWASRPAARKISGEIRGDVPLVRRAKAELFASAVNEIQG